MYANFSLSYAYENTMDNDSTFPESENIRFSQEELFRHGSLTKCNKKLVLTVKLNSDTDSNFENEYIPIEHVINGPSKRRTRLLNPYVLRLRREPPLQAYELRKIDTVSGIVTHTEYEEDDNPNIKRLIREFKRGNTNWYYNENSNNKENVDFVTLQELNQIQTNIPVSEETEITSVSFKNRLKRREYGIEQQRYFDDKSQISLTTNNLIPESLYDNANKKYEVPEDDSYANSEYKEQQRRQKHGKSERESFRPKPLLLIDNNKLNVKYNNNFTTARSQLQTTHTQAMNNLEIVENIYNLYEIGKPNVWSTVHVQLFEKLSDPNGQTVWNDVTKGESPSVSSSFPDWGNENMDIKYQSTEWVNRQEFTLPTEGLCLLAPIPDTGEDYIVDNISFINGQEYFVVPSDAIVPFEDTSSVIKRSNNNADFSTESISNDQLRRVQIRLSRALFSGTDKNINIATRGKDRFLTFPYQQPCRGQIDLEAKADGNQLVTVGSPGRITTAVSDSTRPMTTTLTIQSTNNGLAAARFRAVVRECRPALINEFTHKNSEEIITDRILIPPKQTHMMKLQISNEIPMVTSHCTVALFNDFDEQVAVRDVTVRKGDRCFCVWHCDCVCLSEDPKLLCREMPLSRQVAAGLSSQSGRRHARSVCYNDIVSIDICVIIIGVITTLLLLGFIKSLLGLFVRPVRNWGLDRLLQTPRKLDHYYEKSLSSRPVEYDADGWPVHPDTKKRTVHLISRPMECVLNLIFFIVMPCLVVCDAIKRMINRFKSPRKAEPGKPNSKESKKCFSSVDIQCVEPRWRGRQRRGRLRTWMTPQAEELSADMWRRALPSQQPIKCEFMQPLLQEQFYRNGNGVIEGQESYVDSEQNDTEYVLMQMQKSKDSLKQNQRKLHDLEVLPNKYSKGRDLSRSRNN